LTDLTSTDQPYVLDALPENYRLYEHIKSKSADADGNAARATKTHAGGGHDRQDAYLYGHPLGRKKRYRSPADFFPHLLWLATDETGDPNNCSCKLCAPDDIQPEEKQVNVLRPSVTIKKDDAEKKPIIRQTAFVEIPAESSATKLSQMQVAPGSASNTLTSQPATPQQVGPTALPQPRSLDQQVDFQYNKFTFRNGEMVWFQREGGTWGLGVIVRRWLSKDRPTPSNRSYMIQPLSYPNDFQIQRVIDSENELRPWLAWSPPEFMNPQFQTRNQKFDTVNWTGLTNGRYGHNDKLIDASIMAARAIESSYTLFDPVKTINQDTSQCTRQWNGIFFGSEKIWSGDPVRLKGGGPEDVLVISLILERTTSGNYNGIPVGTTKIFLIGDHWTIVEYPSRKHLPQPLPNIPPRMRDDLAYRNTVSASFNGPQLYWKLVTKMSNLEISQIRGRWYESSMLLPILDGRAAFENARRQGKVGSLGTRLNSRMEIKAGVNGSNAQGEPKASRRDALGQAVPVNVVISADTVEPPQPHEMPPPETPSPVQQQAQQMPIHDVYASTMAMDTTSAPTAGATLDDLMNFDHFGAANADSMPGFGHDYAGQDLFRF
jgi:Transcription-silencing protein, cryptic loci regulator Clr2/Transcription-silencing protein Clr2